MYVEDDPDAVETALARFSRGSDLADLVLTAVNGSGNTGTLTRSGSSSGSVAAGGSLANSIGLDLTQLGIMMTINLAIGLYTPPVGTTLFITSALAKVKVGQTVRELGPFYLVAFSVLALVSYVPASITCTPLASR